MQLPGCHTVRIASFCLLDHGREKKVLSESRQALEVTPARASGLDNLMFSRQTGLSSANFRLLIIQWSLLCPSYQVNGYEPWARNSMLVTCNACSIKISPDSCRVPQIDKRKKSSAGKCSAVIYSHKNWFLSTMELTFLLDVPMKLNKRGCFSTADWKYTCFVLETCLQI